MVNSKGKEIKTFGGLITAPTYDERGYTSFLISSYWLKKLIVIPEYNPTLYNLVYNIIYTKLLALQDKGLLDFAEPVLSEKHFKEK